MAEGVDRLSLRHPGGTTTVFVGRDAAAAARPMVGEWLAGRLAFVISSPRVLELHRAAVEALAAPAARVKVLTVPDGEEAKSLEHAGRLWCEMLAAGGKRDSRVIAFGGGSVGDLAGFVAGCFLRGVEYLQQPTTLLAQVDAALGGKTAIDLGATKNSIGLFHHPALVVSDVDLLATLPRDEVRSALAEVVKTALILDPLLLERVERDLDRLLDADADALQPVVLATARAKLRVVERDPREGDQRRLLNFGHTLAHAIETHARYRGILHGEAVSIGMVFAAERSEALGLSPAGTRDRLAALLERAGLPTRAPDRPRRAYLSAIAVDKKKQGGNIHFVVLKGIGNAGTVSLSPREILPPGWKP